MGNLAMRRVLACVLGFTLMMALQPAFAQTGWRVIDGDTVERQGITYRLIDYDTPETFFAQCKAERMLGIKAKERLASLLSDQGVDLKTDGARDRYRRTLATMTINGVAISQIMVSEGLAVPYVCPKNRCARRINWCDKLTKK